MEVTESSISSEQKTQMFGVKNIEQVFNSHRTYKYELRKTSAKQRLKKLVAFKQLVIQYKDQICQAVYNDFHKAEVEVELTEVMPVISMVNLLEKELDNWMRDRHYPAPLVFKGTSSWVRPEGKGNCLIISPWNYPFQLCVYPILTAYAAGNTCIVKPSEYTPHTNKIIIELMQKVFTLDEVAFFEGEADVATALLNLPFDHIFFTGSTAVGKVVMSHAAKHLASVALELGGKSPAVVDPQTDLAAAAKKIIWGKMVNCGQTCVAPDYVLVREDQVDQLVAHMKNALQEFYGTDDYSQAKDYGHIITERHANRLMQLIQQAVHSGAKLEVGGKQYDKKRIISPTILTNISLDMDIMKDEIFGPVLPIVSYKSEEEIIPLVNSFDNALAMYIFSPRTEFQNKLIDFTTNGGVTINDTLIAVGHPTLPFGGAGKSGIGKYHGKYGFDEFSNLRPIMKRSIELGTSYFYPPYSESKTKLVKTLLKKFSSWF